MNYSFLFATIRGVFQTLVERHFPASTRGRALDIIKQVSNSHKNRDSPNLWKRKKKEEEPPKKKQKKEDSSDPESNDSSSDVSDIGFISTSDSDMSSSEDEEHNPFANGWNSDDGETPHFVSDGSSLPPCWSANFNCFLFKCITIQICFDVVKFSICICKNGPENSSPTSIVLAIYPT